MDVGWFAKLLMLIVAVGDSRANHPPIQNLEAVIV